MVSTKVTRIANPQKRGKKNPWLATLANPNSKGGVMAKKTKRASNSSTATATKPKPKRRPNGIAVSLKKKGGSKKHRPRSANPTLFGKTMSNTDILTALFGGLLGVTVTKLVPPMLPAEFLSSNAARVLASGAVAVLAGYSAASVNKDLGLAVAFGGGMQALSVALNGFLPSVGAQIGLQGLRRRPMPGRGMGALVNTAPINVFNPIRASNQLGDGSMPAGAFPAPSADVYAPPY